MNALLSSALLLSAIPLHADDAWGARLTLVSEQAVIAPGQPFELGVRIHHREGFHTYWKNPGRVGFATRVEWKLPEGFTAGALVWPPPELVEMAGNTAHGYHRDVLLTATITPPEILPQKEVALGARIAWMACSDACHPGDQRFSITLPVGSEPTKDANTTALFAKARSDPTKPLSGWKVELVSNTDASQIVLQLVRTADEAPRLEDPYFFSSDGQIADGRPTVASQGGDGITWQFPRAEFGPRGAEGLPGLIAYGPKNSRHFASIAP